MRATNLTCSDEELQELNFVETILTSKAAPPQPSWEPYISPTGVRIGLVMFSTHVSDFLSISNGTSVGGVLNRLNALPVPGGLININE